MRTVGVVGPAPAFDLELSVLQGKEVVLVEALDPESPVEALDVGVLHRLPRLNELAFDTAIGRPGIKRLTPKLAAIVERAALAARAQR